MTAENFPRALSVSLGFEGAFSNNPKDPGGPTNLGVTQATWAEWCGHACSVADIRALTRVTVTPLYKSRYWDAVAADALPSGVDLLCFDGAINQGPAAMARMLQTAAGVTADGDIGAKTLHAVIAMPARALLTKIYSQRSGRYKNDGDFPTFGAGWMRRLIDVTTIASAWAGAPATA